MAVNFSSSNDSVCPSPNDLWNRCCLITGPSSIIAFTFFITSILLLLALCILVIYLGLQRWRQQRSTSAAAAVTSHSDSFTYHMVTMELIGVLGCGINCFGIYEKNSTIVTWGDNLWYFTSYGEICFHVLTCVERYLAVVHPVTYLSLRGERGIRIRNISIGCVWLVCIIISASYIADTHKIYPLHLELWVLVFTLIVISFCSVSVLLVLIRPGPGEQGGNRDRVDQTKRRAFYTILAILGVLLLRFCMNLGFTVLYLSGKSTVTDCVMTTMELWFYLPCSLVLPLLFLHRAGTLVRCMNKKNKG